MLHGARTARARHILHDDGRRAGDMHSKIAREPARIEIDAAARCAADDQLKCLACIEIGCMGLRRKDRHDAEHGKTYRRGDVLTPEHEPSRCTASAFDGAILPTY